MGIEEESHPPNKSSTSESLTGPVPTFRKHERSARRSEFRAIVIDANELHKGTASLGDNDLLASDGALDQPGELTFGFVHVDLDAPRIARLYS